MKKAVLSIIFAISILQLSYAQEGFTIHGKLTSTHPGLEIKLACERYGIDTIIALGKNGKFQFAGHTEEPAKASIRVQEQGSGKYVNSVKFYLENARYKLTAKLPDLNKATLRGSPVNDSYNELMKRTAPYQAYLDSFRYQKNKGISEEDQQKRRQASEEARNNIDKEKKKFVEEHPNTWQALILLNDYAKSNMHNRSKGTQNDHGMPDETLKTFYAKLSPELQQSTPGKGLYATLYESNGIKEGEKYIELTDTYTIGNDELFKMADIKTDFVLVEFTSTWCGGCIKFKKAMIPEYDKIKDKVEIISFYTDTNKEKITKEKEAIDWVMVSDFKGTYSPTLKRYQVYPIPDFFFFDKNRKLIRHQLGFNGSIIDYIIELSTGKQ